MKIKLFFAAMLLCLISCSDDDTSGQKQLQSTVTTTLNDIKTTFYNNNKPILSEMKSASGQLYGTVKYEYNSQGLLSKVTNYEGDVVVYSETLTYDNNDRISKAVYYYLSRNNTQTTQISTFAYNNDNTITKTFLESDGRAYMANDVFTVNEQGLIYMKQNPYLSSVLAYEGTTLLIFLLMAIWPGFICMILNGL